MTRVLNIFGVFSEVSSNVFLEQTIFWHVKHQTQVCQELSVIVNWNQLSFCSKMMRTKKIRLKVKYGEFKCWSWKWDINELQIKDTFSSPFSKKLERGVSSIRLLPALRVDVASWFHEYPASVSVLFQNMNLLVSKPCQMFLIWELDWREGKNEIRKRVPVCCFTNLKLIFEYLGCFFILRAFS